MADRANLANLAPWLTETISDEMRKHFDTGAIALDILEKGDMHSPGMAAMMPKQVGEVVIIPAHVGGHKNAGTPSPEGKSYGRTGAQVRDVLKYVPKRLTTSLQDTAEAIARSSGDQSMVEGVMAREFVDAMNDTRHKENLFILGDGSGLMATTTGQDWDASEESFFVTDTSKLVVGMEVTPYARQDSDTQPTGWPTASNTLGTESRRALITAIDSATGKVTVTDESGTTFGTGHSVSDYGTEVGLYYGDGQGEVPWGLGIICDDADPQNHGFNPASENPTDTTGVSKMFGGVQRSSNSWWQGYDHTALANAPINLRTHIGAVQRALVTRDSTLAMQYGKIYVLSDQFQWDQIAYQLDSAKRTDTRKRVTENQWEVLEYGLFRFGYDPMMESGTFYFFDPEDIHRLVLEEWGFEERGGSRYTQQQGALGRPTSVWQGNLATYKQTVCSSCRHMARITGAATAAA